MECTFCKKPVDEEDRIMKVGWVCPERQHANVHDEAGTCTFEYPNGRICATPLEEKAVRTEEFACRKCRDERQARP